MGIQYFQAESSLVSKIIENRTLETIASKKRFASSTSEEAFSEGLGDTQYGNLVVFRDKKGKPIEKVVPRFPIMLANFCNSKIDSDRDNNGANSYFSDSNEDEV